MTCKRCHEPIVYQGDWPSCRCDSEPRLALTVREAASYLCVSRSTAYDLIATGDIFANRAIRPARVSMRSLKAYLAAHYYEWRNRLGCYRGIPRQ